MSEQQTAVVERSGVQAPAPGRWELDPAHTTAAFSVRHMGISRVHGLFKQAGGEITVAEDPADSEVVARIAADSIDTGEEDRDAHLRSGDFLDVEQHPELVFRSTAVRPLGDGRWEVDGDLTVRDRTHPVTLEATFEGGLTDPWGSPRIVARATTRINREVWGLTWNMALEAGGVLVGKEVDVTLEVQATLADSAG